MSPWAIFTIPITPKMSERPRAMRAMINPQMRPLIRRKRTVDTISGNANNLCGQNADDPEKIKGEADP
jgi:hypothetical protein